MNLCEQVTVLVNNAAFDATHKSLKYTFKDLQDAESDLYDDTALSDRLISLFGFTNEQVADMIQEIFDEEDAVKASVQVTPKK